MSKYIPTDNKPKGQVKPKLKVKVTINNEEKTLNEYDVFQMLSDLNNRQLQCEKLIQEIGQAVTGIMDGMKAGAGAVTDASVQEDPNKPVKVDYSNLQLPKLNKVEDVTATVKLED